jgi:hypothetical protein
MHVVIPIGAALGAGPVGLLGLSALGAFHQLGRGQFLVRPPFVPFRLGRFSLGNRHEQSPKWLLLKEKSTTLLRGKNPGSSN